MQRIYILGETTYDIIFKNNKPIDAKVGGSQLNTAVSLGRLKLPLSFITQIGKDNVGDICALFIKENGIDDSLIKRNEGASRVALAFLDENNNANYSFFRAENSGTFSFTEINANDIILFGSSFAMRADIREELVGFLKLAKEKHAIIIYDPNFRKSNDLEKEKRLQIVKQNMQLASIVKGSDDDFINIFGADNSLEIWKEVRNLGVKALFYTANKNGVNVHWKSSSLFLDVPVIKPKSTIGAGDSFSAGIIYSLFKKGIKTDQLENLSSEDWRGIGEKSISFAQEVCLSYDNYISVEFAKSILQN